MKTRCLIVDDEPLAIKLIEKHLARLDSFVVIGSCNSALKAFEFLSAESVDLLFLDIKMPTISGLDLLKTLKSPPKTILTTAYRDYALEGYDLDVIDYLLKPITFERFFKAIERYSRSQSNVNLPTNIPDSHQQSPDFILIKSGNKHHKINTRDILYIESLKDYVKVFTNQKVIVSKYKISDLEQDLATHSFVRIHRSFIVNLDQVTAFTPYDVELGEIEIPIGASYKEKVKDILKP